MCRFLSRLLVAAIYATSFLVTTFIFINLGANVESKVNPVKVGWTVTAASIEGNDLIVRGIVVKRRDCSYIAPVRAITREGVHLRVISNAINPDVSWPSNELPQEFGPWRVVNGAGNIVRFAQEHQCHKLWNTYAYLGEYDANSMAQLSKGLK